MRYSMYTTIQARYDRNQLAVIHWISIADHSTLHREKRNNQYATLQARSHYC